MSDSAREASAADDSGNGDGGAIRVAKIHDLRAGTASAVAAGGRVILVDRLWPRGVAKDDVDLDGWFKEVAPSPGLRKWFGHDPAKFEEFTARYRRELDESAELSDLRRAAEAATVAKPLVLAYAARDRDHNHALVLAEWLREAVG